MAILYGFRIGEVSKTLQDILPIFISLQNIFLSGNVRTALDFDNVKRSAYCDTEEIYAVGVAFITLRFQTKFLLNPRADASFCLVEHPCRVNEPWIFLDML